MRGRPEAKCTGRSAAANPTVSGGTNVQLFIWCTARRIQRRETDCDCAQYLKLEAIMAKEPKQLDELFHDTLKDIYFAEKKILATLPKMAKAAQSPDLQKAFEKHRGETEGHVARLEKVFAAIDKKPQAKTCDAIVGITEEGAEIMKEYKGSPALDAGLLAAAQAVEHYEMSRYGTLRTWAQELGLNDAVRLLDQTLDEEKKTDAALTKIAETVVNQQAEAA
jgi:ferritin-like metal-binding protein YciE